MNPLQLVALLGVIVGSAAGYEFAEPLRAQQLSINSQINDALEAFRSQIACGFPEFGIPPLDPLLVEESIVNLALDNISLNGTVENLRLVGLSDFNFDVRLNLLLSKVTFNFVWKDIHLNTQYDLLFKNNENNSDIQIQRSGLADIAVKGLKVWGQSRYSISVIGNHLKLKEFTVFVSIDKVVSNIGGLSSDPVINRQMNDIIEEWIKSTINNNTKRIGEASNKYVVPKVNEAIGNKSLKEIIAAIGGGKGGPTVPKEPCRPQGVF